MLHLSTEKNNKNSKARGIEETQEAEEISSFHFRTGMVPWVHAQDVCH